MAFGGRPANCETMSRKTRLRGTRLGRHATSVIPKESRTVAVLLRRRLRIRCVWRWLEGLCDIRSRRVIRIATRLLHLRLFVRVVGRRLRRRLRCGRVEVLRGNV